jgi:hypothetical protein
MGWIIGLLAVGFVLWCLCVASGKSSRRDEELEILERLHENEETK